MTAREVWSCFLALPTTSCRRWAPPLILSCACAGMLACPRSRHCMWAYSAYSYAAESHAVQLYRVQLYGIAVQLYRVQLYRT